MFLSETRRLVYLAAVADVDAGRQFLLDDAFFALERFDTAPAVFDFGGLGVLADRNPVRRPCPAG